MKRSIGKLISISTIMLFFVLAVGVSGALAQPDLGITQLQVSPSLANPGEPITVNIQVTNVGVDTASGANISADVTNSGTTVITHNFDGIALDPGETQTFSFTWTPYVTGTYNVEAGVSVINDSNSANDNTSTTVTVTTNPGAVIISDFFATPQLFADPSGCLMQPLVVSGFVKENGVGTSDRVYIYVDNQLKTFVQADPSNNGYFRASIAGACFDHAGTYTVRADVDRGNGVLATASQDSVVSFNPIENGTPGIVPGGLYAVDIQVTPFNLNVETGDSDQYLIRIKNLGNQPDTYFLTIQATDSKVNRWTSLTGDKVELQPGEVAYAYMNVEIPEDADLGKYSIFVRANGISQDVDRVILNVVAGKNYGNGGSGLNYAVDLAIIPQKLNIEAGKSGSYAVKIKNLGNLADTYKLKVITDGEIQDWIELETKNITVNPGKTKYVDLVVNAPDGAASRSYPITVLAEGNSNDLDKVDLNVIAKVRSYDVSVGNAILSTDKVWTDKPKTIDVTIPVTFSDFKTDEGQYVSVKLYVSKTVIDTQSVYIPSGETKDVIFHFNTGDVPINNQEGTYNVYGYARIDYERDQGPASTLRVLEPGIVSINLSKTQVNVQPNGTFTLTMTVTNSDYEKNTYDIRSEGVNLSLEPKSVEVASGESKVVVVNGTVGDLPDGDYTATIIVENEKDSSDSAAENMTITVKQKKSILGGGNGNASGVSGYLLLTPGGIAATIVGIMILAAIAGYYVKNSDRWKKMIGKTRSTKGPFGNGNNNEGKKPDEDEGGEAVKEAKEKEETGKTNDEESKPVEPKEIEKAVENKEISEDNLKKMWEAAEELSEETESRPIVWEGASGLDLDRFNIMQEPIDEESGNWGPRDAEHVLLNLDNIKDEFNQHIEHVKAIKNSMGEIAKSTEQKLNLTKKTEKGNRKSIRSKIIGKKGKTAEIKDSYVKDVVESI